LRYLLDSVIVIDHLNGQPAATRFLFDHATQCAISVITRAEVLAGCDDRSEALVIPLLDQFPILPLSVEIADLAARLRRSERWKLPDAIQAAVAIGHELTLVTRNTRDFKPGDQPEVLIPYQL
jgi:predicted nucleic acid-binding protein